MIFLTEILDKCSKKDSLDNNKKALSLANRIANSLLCLPLKDFNKIKSVVIISNNELHAQEIIEREFKQYQMDFSYYKDQGLVYAFQRYTNKDCEFPKPELLENKAQTIKNKIKRLINGASFVTSSNMLASSKEYMCYLPLINSDNSAIMNLPKLFLIQDIEKSRIWRTNEPYIFPKEKYIAIKKILFENSEKEPKEGGQDDYYYNHPPFIQHFDSGLYEELTTIKRNKSKAYFYDGDELVAERSTDYYLKKGYNLFDLSRGEKIIVALEEIKKHDKDYSMINIDKLKESLWRNLQGVIGPIEISDAKIVVQGKKLQLEPYLRNYYEIPIPEMEEIQKIHKILTKLFISLLIEKDKLLGDDRELYQTIKNDGFGDLLSEVKYLYDLERITKEIGEVDVADLLNCPAFWMKLQARIKEINDKSPSKELKAQTKKITWKFTRDGQKWKVYKNKELIIDSKKIGITNIVLICKHYKLYGRKKLIHCTALRRAVLKFEGNNKYNNIDFSKGRGRKGKTFDGSITPCSTWGTNKTTMAKTTKNFTITSKEDEEFKLFLENFENNNEYAELKNRSTFRIIIDEKIDDDFFEDLNESKEPQD